MKTIVPDFIDRSLLRQYLSPTALNKMFKVGHMQVGSYLQKRKNEGRPAKSKNNRYRPLDVIAAGKAEGLEIKPSNYIEKATTLVELEKRIKAKKEILKKYDDLVPDNLAALNDSMVLNTKHKRLLRESEIVEQAKPVHTRTGVYFLVKDDRVVYVGQSINVYARVNDHIKNGKDFDNACYIPCLRQGLNVLESLYIHVLQPEQNGHAPISLLDLMYKDQKNVCD
jgi:hypothetical protein